MGNQPYRLQPTVGKPTNATQAVDFLISAALKRNASDIHLGVNHTAAVPEPFLLRFRTHGKLQLMNGAFLLPIYKEVISRIKIMAGLNTTEIGTPQDGQINVLTLDGAVVLRVALIPGPEGDELVIRVQRAESENKEIAIANLGMEPEVQDQLVRLINQKSGLIALNGPAGSGKTSTIYAILKQLASPERKVLTAEDPIETRIPFVSHTQVSSKTNFSALARAFMRQDSEVIFIGEVRDEESASATVQLAQTGHLVLTTMHTRDAIGVIARLEAFEIHSNFIANSLIGSLAQRLIPTLCLKCRVPHQLDGPTLALLQEMGSPQKPPSFFKAGPGCPQCTSGYSGRKAVFELFVVDSELADMINRTCSRTEIFEVARAKGMRTLVDDMLSNVYAGITDVHSVKGYLFSPSYSLAIPKLKAA